MLFGPGYTGVRKSFEQDPFGALSLAAGVRDTMRAFPQAHGVIVDGAGEQHYELDFHHGGELFEIRDQQNPCSYGHGRGVDGARHRYPPRSLLPPDAIAGALPQRGWLNTSAPIFSNLLSDRMPGDLLKP